jgi:RNA recognition motif-containing protein
VTSTFQPSSPISVTLTNDRIHTQVNQIATMADTSRLKATVFVGGLDHAVTQQTLYHAFLPFGDIVEVNLPKPDLPSSKDPHRGFGYVEFENATDATDAIDNMDRSELYGQVIKVAAAKPQKDHNEGLGSKTAVWEQVSISTFADHVVIL